MVLSTTEMSGEDTDPAGRTKTAHRKQPLLVLVGPTAAGKTALALRVALRLGAEIISADSAQVYRGLDIGTAKPTEEERRLVHHHLLDLVNPDEDFSVADFQREALRVIAAIGGRGRLPFLVGGTGLYVDAVLHCYTFFAGGKNEDLRERLAEEARRKGIETLHDALRQVDPEAAARIHPRDQKRIIRALEVYRQEGRPISEQVALTRRQEPVFRDLAFALSMPREALYRRINRRVEEMMQAGFRAEVERLLDAGYSPQCRGLQALGYRQVVNHLLGKAAWKETVADIQQETRHLAKRQLTWFRRNSRLRWLAWGGEHERELDELAEIISSAAEGKESVAGEY